ncbi:conserved hypothetical protein [Methanocella paludicola SANAE]|uniref:Uncharacterized protein n=1 Tax=Methanocella paludicola (strain DSM 17711 / JCM 13418 / NBRC 101707 / SANAE) TaxID=304371 RepID=D1Z1U1_METPS|nr:hypothetical protein [Methanocella paludicola]BAI62663.1 conserved hypothetical protein [Methanocella paludicola SANAE]
MKQNTLIAIVLGVVIVGAAALVALNYNSLAPGGGNTTPTAAPPAVKTASDVLEKFDLLKAKINASGMWFGGAAVQNLMGDETAMVYIYKPAGSSDDAGLMSKGFTAVYDVFQTQDPLLVGLIDTTQKVSDQQYKVDVYALERPLVELYAAGNLTPSEMVKNALIITPNSTSLRANATSTKQATALPKPTGNFTPPADRQAYLVESLNRTSYKPLSLQVGSMADGGKAVSLACSMPGGLDNAQKYNAIETGLKLCAAAFGDYDRYYLSLISEQGNEYYVIDAGAVPVLDYGEGSITQDQLYRNINLTYYTK